MASISTNSRKSVGRARAVGAKLLTLPVTPDPQLDGLLALLVTDLEDFTPLVERLGDIRAQQVIQQHNRLVRACIRRWRGQEVAHTGDGVMAAFRSIAAALHCARDIQLALTELSGGPAGAPLRARMGLHAGEPLPEEDRLFGHCVNTAVRVCNRAEAGHVLVTDVVKQLAQGRFSFCCGGLHTLKGLSTPVRLYEYGWDEACQRAV